MVAADMSPLYSSAVPSQASNETLPFSGQGENRNFCLPRLSREYYQGDAVVHWTMPMAKRGTGWLNDFSTRVSGRQCFTPPRGKGLFCPAYCLMPDHIHLLWLGLRRDTDQRNGMKFLREHLGPRCIRIISSIRRTTTSCGTKNESRALSPESAFTSWPIPFALD